MKIVLIILLSFFSYQLQAADSTISVVLANKVNGNFKNFEVDNLGNIYVVTPTNQIIKYNSNYDSVACFNNSRLLGNISNVDVSNPLKILVFYKGFATIIVLDRFLAILNTIDLQKQNIFSVSTITCSYDNNIWIFDEVDYKLKKIDNEGKTLLSSIDFRLLFKFENNLTAEYLKEFEGKLYIYNKQNGLLVFDYYGGLQHRIPLLGLSNVQLFTNKLLGINAFKIFEIQDTKKQTSQLIHSNFNIKNSLKSTFRNNLMYSLNADGVEVYSLVN